MLSSSSLLRSALLATMLMLALGCSSESEEQPDMQRPNDQGPYGPDQGPPDLSADMGDRDMPPAPKLALRFEEIALDTEVSAITELLFVPDKPGELLVTRKPGELLHFALDGDSAALQGRVAIPGVYENSDCGLISAIAAPDFTDSGHIYLGYCTGLGVNRVVRYTLDTDDLSALPQSAVTIIEVNNPAAEKSWHNVGSMAFDDEGYLWVLFGENRANAQAQDRSTNTGALLRIRPLPEGGFEPHPQNPFVDEQDASPAIYAYGLRSPWRGLLDQQGRFWIGDVGSSVYEEVNVAHSPGLNFGWPTIEGRCTEDCEGFTDPLITWDQELDHPFAFDDPDTQPTNRRVVWVGLAYRSEAGDEDPYAGLLDDKVLYGDFCTGWVRAAQLDADNKLAFDASTANLPGVVSWAQADDGLAYVVTYGNCQTFPYKPGKLYRARLAP